MTILYNCKHAGDQYQITKFDDGDPVSSYLCTTTKCTCPAGVRPMCRHREMLLHFIHRGAVDTGWWYDYDRGGWEDNRTEDELDAAETALIKGASQEVAQTIVYTSDEPPLPFNHVELFAPIEPHSTEASAPDFDSGDAGSNPAGVAKDEYLEGISQRQRSTYLYHEDGAVSQEIPKQPYRKPKDGRRA